MINYRATKCGWFAFEGFGRPYEAWVLVDKNNFTGWKSLGRTFTRSGALRKARRYIL